MQTIRTTITLPLEKHRELREKAFKYNKSLNQVIVDQLFEKPERGYSARSVEEKVAEDFAFFDKIANMGEQIDATKVVREERDRDNT